MVDDRPLLGRLSTPPNRGLVALLCRCGCFIMITIPAVYIAVSRNAGCDPKLLADKIPPYGGELIPKHAL